VLGIKDGTTNTAVTDEDRWINYQRFMTNSYDALVDLSKHGSDFELEPNFTDPDFYANLNVYDRQGTDKSATVRLQHSFGGDDLDEMTTESGGNLITHALSVSRRTASTAPTGSSTRPPPRSTASTSTSTRRTTRPSRPRSTRRRRAG
jgi:hypothetical protein